MSAAGMLNVGQVVRERHGRDRVALVGFGGHHGSVIAASSWGGATQSMSVPPAPERTHEDLLHQALGVPSLFVFPDDRATPWLSSRRGHRAIGVVYLPEGERRGNWVPTVLGMRYDAFLSFDSTEALHPLHGETVQRAGELETFPTGDLAPTARR
jgi:erythromycin esterase-like protein